MQPGEPLITLLTRSLGHVCPTAPHMCLFHPWQERKLLATLPAAEGFQIWYESVVKEEMGKLSLIGSSPNWNEAKCRGAKSVKSFCSEDNQALEARLSCVIMQGFHYITTQGSAHELMDLSPCVFVRFIGLPCAFLCALTKHTIVLMLEHFSLERRDEADQHLEARHTGQCSSTRMTGWARHR